MRIKFKFMFMVLLGSFYPAIAIPVALIPGYITSRPVTFDLSAWQKSHFVKLDSQRIVEVAFDHAAPIDTHRVTAMYMVELAAQQEYEKYRSLRSLFARYIESAHLFGDEGLAAAISDSYGYHSTQLDAESDDDDFDDCAARTFCNVDSSAVINQVVRRVLQRHSFETVDGVSVAIKELEQGIQSSVLTYGSGAHEELVRDLQDLNSEPLSASYHCMKKVSRVLGQLPPESAQAIRDQFPWYLRRMV